MSTDWIVEREFFPRINHYYGSAARHCIVIGVILMIFCAPFYADSLSTDFPLEIIGALLMIIAAALTNPQERFAIMADSALSGAAAVLFALWAFTGYGTASTTASVLRSFIALIFIVAFYFSLKTFRAMMLHQIGKPDSPVEFRRAMPPAHAEELISEETIVEAGIPDPLQHEHEVVERVVDRERGD